jgi:hypothetical protein
MEGLDMTDNNGWISFAERRPTKEDADEAGFVTMTNGDRQWFSHVSLSGCAPIATHWMPFRPPAKEPSEVEKARAEYMDHVPTTSAEWFDMYVRIIRAVVREEGK